MAPSRLSTRTLGRTLLARQHLLERTTQTISAVVADVVGLQAQVPRDPYLGLWSRIDGFEPRQLEQLLLDHEVVRIALMRSTIHLVTAADALALRPLVAPVLEHELARHAQHAPHLRDADLGPVLDHARTYLAEPRSNQELRDELARRFPAHDAAALTYACRNHLGLVQVPPRGLWQRSGPVTCATAASWLSGTQFEPAALDDMVRRYLGAFGPASVADLSTWSRLTGLREVVERLRPSLRTYRDDAGRELFDVDGAAIADADAEAPVRFLPEYDNVLLSHADRSRVVDREGFAALVPPRGTVGAVLVDGLVQAAWRLDRDRVVVTHHRLDRRDRDAVEAEAMRARALLAPGVEDAAIELQPAENAGGPE